jgi:hypothetical protein
MKVQCKNCLQEEIEIPDFNQMEKHKLYLMTIQSPINSTKFIMDNFSLSHKSAKFIVKHINKTYRLCNNCNYDKLDEEFQECPKCGSLNFNWRE